MQRSIHLFENAIKSKASFDIYMYSLDRFRNYHKIKDYDSLLQFPDKELQTMIEDYIFYLKKRVAPNSIRSMYSGIELFFVINERNLNWKKMRKFFPALEKRTGKDAWTTDHIQKMLQVEKGTRNRAIVHFMASTGCRVGALPDLKVKNLSNMPLGSKAVLLYDDSIDEYYSFLTPEASKALDDYFEERKQKGELIQNESWVFRRTYQIGIAKPQKMSVPACKSVIPKLIKNARIKRERKGTRYNIQNDHGFRKRFNTILKQNKDIPYAITERLLGHRDSLDAHYFAATKEELFEGFRKAIADLTINDSEKLRIENKNKQKKIQELESDKKRISELELKMENIKELLKRVSESSQTPLS